jgi:NADH-quinone oxidoreductase subunit G
MMVAMGRSHDAPWRDFDEITAALARTLPVFEAIEDIAPPAGFRMAGQKVPRQPHRYSGRTAMHANVDVHEPMPPADPDSPLSFSMEGYEGQPPSSLVPRFWAPGWNSMQAVTRFQEEVSGPLRGGDPGRRLIEPRPDAAVRYFSDLPRAFPPRPDQWLLVPLYHIFGSEELSVLSPGIAQLAPAPYLALSPSEAARAGIGDGEHVLLDVEGFQQVLSARLMPSLPQGVAGLPVGLAGMAYIVLPCWAKLSKAMAR